MDKTDLGLIIGAIGVLLSLGATPVIALTALVTYLITRTLR
jgi:hypothetical protein